jgi:fucose 4-O-acetylase-like acetyltransferase
VTVAPTAPLQRNATLDGMKYVAAVTIVLHHVAAHESGSSIGAFLVAAAATALFFFFAASGYLHGDVGGRGRTWLWRRFKRLAIPYALWSVVYLVVAQRALIGGGEPYLPNPLLVIFFAGAHGILWFLPMLLACAVLTDLLVRGDRSRRIGIGLCVVATVVVYVIGTRDVPVGLVNFVLAPRWLLVYLGGMEIRAHAPRGSVATPAGVAGIAAVLAVGAVHVVDGASLSASAQSIETLLWVVGSLAILLATIDGARWWGVARLDWGRDYFLGIYVTHVLWLGTFFTVIPADSWPPALWILAGWLFCVAGASLTTFVLKSFRLTRPMVV